MFRGLPRGKYILIFLLLLSSISFSQEGGYPNKMSVSRGDTLKLYISTSVSPFTLSIYKSENTQQFITSFSDIPGEFQEVPDSSYWYGCRWNETFNFVIPDDWETGVYRAKFPVTGGTREILFVVRETIPGSHSNILFMLNTNTWNAYNDYGGKSTYEYNSTDKQPSAKVSFQRPPDNTMGFEDFFDKEELFIKWAYRNNINLEYAINYDVHVNPGLLSNYDVVVTSGHSEYWSRPERLEYERYIASGGKVMILSGNNVWWQIRYEDDGNTMVSFKEQPDPLAGVIDSLVTVNWKNPPLNYPENSFTGTSFASGGYVNRNAFFAEDGFADYSAYNTHHWVFNGTGLTEGEEFGTQSAIVGVEVDGAKYNWVNGIPVPTGVDQSPTNYRVLGFSPALNYDNTIKSGMMGLYYLPGGGALFNASTMNWNHGLAGDTIVEKITLNVLQQFLSGHLPPEIVSWEPSIVEPAVINEQNVFVNNRTINLTVGIPKKFAIKAEDPNQTVQFLWTVNGVESGTDSVFNFEILDSTLVYNITAYAYNSTDTSSISWVVNTIFPEGPLAAPVQVSPANNSVGQNLDLTLEWNNSESAANYHVQLALDSLFSHLYTDDTLTTATSENIYGLAFSTNYYWRVKAKAPGRESEWSPVWTFRTKDIGSTIPGGYSNRMSVTKGDTIIFYISTPISPFTLSFYRSENQPVLVTSVPSITGGLQPVPDSSFYYGCRWNETYRFQIPEDWLPGAYRAIFPIDGGTREVIFYVKERTPGSYGRVLHIANQNTWQAYNNFGGKSIYEFNSTENKRSYKVSFLRPPQFEGGFSDFSQKEEKFIKWAFNNNIPLEHATNYDIHANPSLVNNYDVVVTTGHSEYWSREERVSLQNFVANGGRIVILSGNTCYWQVRYEDNGNTMVCYKGDTIDPLFGINDSLVTVTWGSWPVEYPETILLGVTWEEGGYTNFSGRLLAADGYGDYAAYNTHHWAYNGTSIKEGQEFGYETTTVGYEVDGTLFNWINGIPVTTGSRQAPLNFRILGISPSINGTTRYNSVMGIYHTPAGGALFNASTVDWVDGLGIDPVVNKVTKNVFDKFLSNHFPPEITSWSPTIVTPAVINKDPVYVSKRDITMLPDSTVKFFLTANDPYGGAVSYIWKVNGNTVSNDSVFFFNNDNSLAQYNIEALVYNSRDTASISWKVINLGLNLSQPVLAMPSENQQDVTGNTLFKWNSTLSASKYTLQLSADPSFNTILFSDTTVTDTTKILEPLQSGIQYYWRVKAKNTGAESEWSDTWTFKTVNSPDTATNKIVLNTMNGTFTGDARLGTMSGSINTRTVYFQGTAGGVSFNVNFPASDRNWYIWARMYYMSSGGKNSFYFNGNGSTVVLGDDDNKYNQWHWDGNNGTKINLGKITSGQKTVMISGREPGFTLWIDQVILTDDPFFFPDGFVLKNPGSITLPPPPSLLLPGGNTNEVTVPVTLKWNKPGGATSYKINISKDPDFNVLFADSTLTDTSYVLNVLSPLTTYYWKVNSKNSVGTSDWSPVNIFTTANIDTVPKSKITLNAMNGTFSGDARLGTMSGSANTRVVYFQGVNGGISFNVNLPSSPRSWYIWARMYYMSSGGKNSFFVSANGTKFVLGDDTTRYNQWHWDGNNGAKINLGSLTAGQNTIMISGREPGFTLWIDQLILSDDPDFLPDGFVLRSTEPVNLPPALVQLSSPADSAKEQPLQLSLSWNRSTRAENYILQLSEDQNFNALAASDSALTDSLKLVSGLTYSTTYYWRVRAKNNNGESAWSSVRNFTTIANPDTFPKSRIVINAMNGAFSGDARLGSMSGSINTRVVYFQGTNGGISFNVNVPASPRNWYIWARMYYMSSGGKNSFFVTANGTKLVLGDDTTKYNQWHWDGNNGAKINLGTMAAGQKTIMVSGREPGLTLWVDQLILSDDPDFLPAGFVLSNPNPVNLPPQVALLSAPADTSKNQPVQLQLIWNKSQGASNYFLNVSHDSAFTALAAYDSALTDTVKQISGLAYSSKYFWRVKAKNDYGESAWSNVWSFTTAADPDTIPKSRIVINAMNGAFSGDARLGSMSGSLNTRVVYFQGTNGGISFNVNVPASPRNWYIWARMYYMSSGGKNSFFVSANGSKMVLGDDTTRYNQWHWDGNDGAKINLGIMAGGQKTITVSGREPGLTLWIDQLILSDDPDFIPVGFVLKNQTPVNLPPAVVLLSAPADTSKNQPLQLPLIWGKSAGADNYILHLAKDAAFTALTLYDSTLTDSINQLNALSYSTNYYWRVKAKNDYGESAWSSVWSFTTMADPDTITKTRITINAMNGTFSGDARLGSMTGSINTRVVYFQGTNGGVSFNVDVPSSPRNWFIWAGMYYMSSGGKNSFFVTANGNKLILGDNDSKYNQWHWDGYLGAKLDIGTMTAGQKTILASGREPGLTLWVDQLILTDDSLFNPNNGLAKEQADNEIEVAPVPKEFELTQNFPNPFNPVTTLRYSVPVNSHVVLKVYDILGSEIETLVDEFMEPGFYEVKFDASNLASGIYIYQIRANGFIQNKKMNLLK